VIVIVGGGISGLALGLELRKAGLPYVILEAAPRVGGVIGTRMAPDGRLELGPQRLRATAEIQPFLGELGGHRRPSPELPLLVARHGRLHPVPLSPMEAIRSPVVSTRGKLRAAFEPLASMLPVPRGITAGELLRRRFGGEVYSAFAGPVFGGIYGSDPDRMEAHRTLVPALEALGVRSVLARMAGGRPEGPPGPDRTPLRELPVIVPEGGMEALPRLLHARQADAVRLGRAVHRVEKVPGGGEFRVHATDGPMRAERVVVTAPPTASAIILREVAPELSGALGSLRMNRLVLVHLSVPELPPGLGFQVSFGEPVRIRGVTFSGNLDGSGRTAVAFLGGMADPHAHRAPNEELGATAARELQALTGIPARPLSVHRTAMPAWDWSWRALDEVSPPGGIHLLANYTGRPGIAGRLREAAALARVLQGRSSASSSVARSSASSTP
jgi:protoporphyrinogen/coproporphyrinogen III oxidase